MRRQNKESQSGPEGAPAGFDVEQAERFMRRAIELGRQGAEAGDGGPFGAVIVKEGKIIAEGWNRVIVANDPTAHGEVVAIRAAGERLKSFSLQGCELYTSGEPCPMCLSASYWARLARVFYGFSIEEAAAGGFDDRLIYEELGKPADERKLPLVQLLGREALQELKRYAANPERVRY
ncbi:MAG: nucleoside deaminase [Verrucomicrobiota bacterium]